MCAIIFHPEVALELKASYEWYETQVTGLGGDYLSELESAFVAIEELPKTWPKFKRTIDDTCSANFPTQSFIA